MIDQIPVVLLCGGRGIYLDGSGKRITKALVEVGGGALVFQVIRAYLNAGFRKFILSAGRQVEEYAPLLEKRGGTFDGQVWTGSMFGARYEIRIVDSGVDAKTGDCILAVKRYLEGAPCFGATYSDTLSDVRLDRVFEFHRESKKVGTLVAALMPSRFRIVGLRYGETTVRAFADTTVLKNDYVVGGFYFFDTKIFESKYLGRSGPVILETDVLERLAADQELEAWPHDGIWRHLDSERDWESLKSLIPHLYR